MDIWELTKLEKYQDLTHPYKYVSARNFLFISFFVSTVLSRMSDKPSVIHNWKINKKYINRYSIEIPSDVPGKIHTILITDLESKNQKLFIEILKQIKNGGKY